MYYEVAFHLIIIQEATEVSILGTVTAVSAKPGIARFDFTIHFTLRAKSTAKILALPWKVSCNLLYPHTDLWDIKLQG
jgi:hypothetical protein